MTRRDCEAVKGTKRVNLKGKKVRGRPKKKWK